MLSGGLSLEVFKQWAPFEQNMVVVPGYCIPGTVGYKLVPGKLVTIDIDKRTKLEVRCQVHHLSFSAHTDAKGIMDLLRHVGPKHVILVHGEKPKMALLKTRISSELGIPCFDPGNGEVVEIPSRLVITVLASEQFLAPGSVENEVGHTTVQKHFFKDIPAAAKTGSRSGIIMMDQQKTIQILHPQEALNALNVSQHRLVYQCYCPVYMAAKEAEEGEIQEELDKPSKKHCRGMPRGLGLQEHEPMYKDAEEASSDARDSHLLCCHDEEETKASVELTEVDEEETKARSSESFDILHAVYEWLVQKLGKSVLRKQNDCIVGNSLSIRVSAEHSESREAEVGKAASAVLACTWSSLDEDLANDVMSLINTKHIPPP